MRKRKFNIPMISAYLLLILVVLTSNMSGGLFAKYSSGSISEDGARVAKFIVSTDSTFLNTEVFTIEFSPPETTNEIAVKNEGEVTVACYIKIENLTDNIPLTFQLDGVPFSFDEEITSNYIYPNEEETFHLTIKWDTENPLDYMGMVDLIELKIKIEQVQ